MTRPVQTVIFDLGKVLLDFDWSLALDKICARSPLQRIEIVTQVTSDGSVIDYETGKISSAEFFQNQKETFQFDGSWQELSAIWCGIFVPMESNIAMARELAQRCQVGLLSNTNEAHVAHFEAKYDFLSIFPVRVYSCRVGYMKPRREIYEATATALQVDPEQTVFIDDVESNAAAAVDSMGWKAVYLRPGLDLRAALAGLGFKSS
jgi:glucose-1-phosphatase